MDFVAKKYTVLMGNEPIDLWLKNGQVKKAYFMDKRIDLNLNENAIKQIRDNPTKIVNGNTLKNNINFTKSVSKMMSQKLELAISKNDKKTLSRFARSKLVPENMKDNFIEAINRPRGLRGMLVKATNKTNAIFQNLAKNIDRFFDKVNDKIANQKLDKHLQEYQLKEFNKAPPLNEKDMKKHLDPKLYDLAQNFFKETGLRDRKFNPELTEDKILIDKFLKIGAKHGFSVTDTQIAMHQYDDELVQEANGFLLLQEKNKASDLKNEIESLKKDLNVFQKINGSKNETIEDFKNLASEIEPTDKIDILIENKAYQNMSETEKQEFENKELYKQEPIAERANEVKNIVKVIDKAQEFQTLQDRNSTVNFSSKNTKDEIVEKWRELQKINRLEQAQNRDFMNISAVRFGGVSTNALNNWSESAIKRGVDEKIVNKFKDATLRNSDELVKAGIFKEPVNGEYKFVDQFAKESLYKNLDKTNEQIQQANKGNSVQVEINPKDELQERVQNLSSPKSFEKMVGQDGQIDSQKLHEYAKQLQALATQLHTQETSNVVTREDLRRADKAADKQQQQEKSAGAENAM